MQRRGTLCSQNKKSSQNNLHTMHWVSHSPTFTPAKKKCYIRIVIFKYYCSCKLIFFHCFLFVNCIANRRNNGILVTQNNKSTCSSTDQFHDPLSPGGQQGQSTQCQVIHLLVFCVGDWTFVGGRHFLIRNV